MANPWEYGSEAEKQRFGDLSEEQYNELLAQLNAMGTDPSTAWGNANDPGSAAPAQPTPTPPPVPQNIDNVGAGLDPSPYSLGENPDALAALFGRGPGQPASTLAPQMSTPDPHRNIGAYFDSSTALYGDNADAAGAIGNPSGTAPLPGATGIPHLNWWQLAQQRLNPQLLVGENPESFPQNRGDAPTHIAPEGFHSANDLGGYERSSGMTDDSHVPLWDTPGADPTGEAAMGAVGETLLSSMSGERTLKHAGIDISGLPKPLRVALDVILAPSNLAMVGGAGIGARSAGLGLKGILAAAGTTAAKEGAVGTASALGGDAAANALPTNTPRSILDAVNFLVGLGIAGVGSHPRAAAGYAQRPPRLPRLNNEEVRDLARSTVENAQRVAYPLPEPVEAPPRSEGPSMIPGGKVNVADRDKMALRTYGMPYSALPASARGDVDGKLIPVPATIGPGVKINVDDRDKTAFAMYRQSYDQLTPFYRANVDGELSTRARQMNQPPRH